MPRHVIVSGLAATGRLAPKPGCSPGSTYGAPARSSTADLTGLPTCTGFAPAGSAVGQTPQATTSTRGAKKRLKVGDLYCFPVSGHAISARVECFGSQ